MKQSNDISIVIRCDTHKFTKGLHLPRMSIKRRVKFWNQKRIMKRLSKKYTFIASLPILDNYAANMRREEIRQIKRS